MGFFIENQVLLRILLIISFFNTYHITSILGQAQGLMGMKEVIEVDFTEPDTVVYYGEDPYNFAELRIPKIDSTGTYPVAVVIHGGCWLSAVANVDFMSGYASALTQEGYATYNIEYRSADHPAGGWPNTFNDVVQAINYLSTLSSKYPLNLNQIVLIGHSAGGHLALWTTLKSNNHSTPSPFTLLTMPIRGVISLAGIVDLKTYFDPTGQSCGRGVRQLLGGTPEDFPNRYQMASPVYLYNGKSTASLALISGELDLIVPEEHVAILSDAHREIPHFIISNSGHFEMVVPQTAAWWQTIKVLKNMVD